MLPPTPTPRRTSDHLANERTFLAWIRTSIAVIGLGFVVARFSVWLRQLSNRFDDSAHLVHPAHSGLSLPLGVTMMAFGGIMALIAAWRYRHVRQAIIHDEPAEATHVIMVVTVMILVTSATLVAYMLAS